MCFAKPTIGKIFIATITAATNPHLTCQFSTTLTIQYDKRHISRVFAAINTGETSISITYLVPMARKMKTII